VITDMHMPQMDGAALARQLRALSPTLPIVLLSSVNIRQTPDAQLFSSVLTKPARQQALFDALVCAIPAARPAQRKADTKASQFDATLAARMPLRILLAEDNEVNRKVALRMLKGFGYQADVAGNGIEAIAALQRQPYDLVLMDIQMPEMDGLEATRRIVRDFQPPDRPRVVAMSANATRADMEVAVLAGVDDYVVKPISVPVLRAALEKCGELTTQHGRRARNSAAAPLEEGAGGGLAEDHLQNFLQIDASGEFLKVLIESFSANARHLLAKLARAVTEGEAKAADSAAHELTGMSSNLGLREMSRLCQAIEGIAREGTLGGCAKLLAECEHEYERGLSALKLFLARHQQTQSS
jgi:CheY-like chemotaxis protein